MAIKWSFLDFSGIKNTTLFLLIKNVDGLAMNKCVLFFRCSMFIHNNKLCGRPPQYAPAPCKLTFDLLTLKVVSESRVTWVTSVPILVFIGLSIVDLCPMYATDRQTSDAHHRLMPPTLDDIII